MRPIRYVCLTLLLFVPSIAYAGQIYGTIVLSGKGVKAKLEIKCGDEATGGESAADGSYRVNVAQQGQCTLTLPEYKGSSSAIFSGPIDVGSGARLPSVKTTETISSPASAILATVPPIPISMSSG